MCTGRWFRSCWCSTPRFPTEPFVFSEVSTGAAASDSERASTTPDTTTPSPARSESEVILMSRIPKKTNGDGNRIRSRSVSILHRGTGFQPVFEGKCENRQFFSRISETGVFK